MSKISDQILEEIGDEEEAGENAEKESSEAEEKGKEKEKSQAEKTKGKEKDAEKAPEKKAEKKTEKKAEKEGGVDSLNEDSEKNSSDAKKGDESKSFEKTKEGEKADEKNAEEDKEKQATPSSFKVKIRGEEREVDYETAKRILQKDIAANEVFAEASQMKGDAEKFFSLLEKDFMGVGEQLFTRLAKGDAERGEAMFYETVLKWLEPYADRLKMTEDERLVHDERRRLDRERKQFEAERAEAQKRHEEEVSRRVEKAYAEEIERAVLKHKLNIDKKTTDGKRNLSRLVELCKETIEYDLDSTPEDSVLQVIREKDEILGSIKGSLSADEIEKNHPQLIEELLKRRAEKSKAPATPPFSSTSEDEPKGKERERQGKPSVFRTIRSFHDSLREEVGA